MSVPAADRLSVVIPTRDRPERLAATLAALDQQDGAEHLAEVLVVDDGSRQPAAAALAGWSPERYELRWLEQSPSGPAVARNLGIAHASGERVWLLGDDTRPAPGALAAHLARGAGAEVGLQGHIDWDPEHEVTELMAFLAPAGPQFYFAGLSEGQPVPYTAVLGSNFSAPTAWFRDQPFDESFPAAAFEDTELAYRWQGLGRRTVYLPDALCWHGHHYAELAPFLARQRRAGTAARHALRRHPGMVGRGRRRDGWDLRCRGAFLRGLLLG